MQTNDSRNENYQELARMVRDQGWYRPATGRILLQLGLHLTLCFGGLAIGIRAGNLAVQAAGFLLSTAGALGITTNTHTSSHFATAANASFNRFLTYFGYTFLFGTSATYWWHKHCVVHHPTPNLIGIDEDANLMPWFALNKNEVDGSRGWQRLFFTVQWVVIPIAIGLNVMNTQRQGWKFLLRILLDRKSSKPAHWLDLGVLFLHAVTWILLPMMFFAPIDVLKVYLLEMILVGYGMFIAFAPAHYPGEAAFASASEKDKDFVLRQTVTTVNFRTGAIGRLLCSGVDYQIEHHLFPGVPHVYYPALSSIVQTFCEENNYPYRTLGWMEGVWKALLTFSNPKPVLSSLETPLQAGGREVNINDNSISAERLGSNKLST